MSQLEASKWRQQAAACLVVFIVCSLLPVQIDTTRALGFRFAPVDVVLAGLAMWILLRYITMRRPPKSPLVPWAAAALIIWLGISALLNQVELGESFRGILLTKVVGGFGMILFYGVSYAMATEVLSPSIVARIYVLAGSFWSIAGLSAYALDRFGIHNSLVFVGGRLVGLLIDPNAYGGYILSGGLPS